MAERKMKDSGIEWIGEIPENWNIQRGKYLFEQKSERGNKQALVLLSPTQNYGVIPQELYEKLSGFSAVKLNEKTDLNTLKTVHNGAFIISLRSFQGGFEYSQYEGVVSPAYQVFYPIVAISDGYYKYLFKTQMFIEKMNSYTMSLRDGKNIAFADFGRTYIPVPSLDEQIIITSFLDTKCSEIDALTADIQSEIDTLEKYKKSIITEAVTKGLDKNVKMKDSGIEWIGEIPEDWEIIRIADLYEERNERGNETLPLLSVSINSGVSDKELSADEQERNFIRSEDKTKYKRVYPGDLTYNMMRAWQGAFGAVRVEGMVSPAYVVAKPKPEANIDTRFIEALLRSPMGINEMDRYSYGIMDFRKRLYWPQFRIIKVCIPTIEEQHKIADYIDKKSIEIANIISEKQRILKTLEAYKKSLIYEYVTGKKEIPHD